MIEFADEKSDDFNQLHLVDCLEQDSINQKYTKLVEINQRYNGLCEIICNLVLSKDLMKNDSCLENNYFKNNITLDKLLDVQNSHLIEVVGRFKLFFAIVFHYYVYNIFSWYDQIFNLTVKNENGEFVLNKAFIIQQLNKLTCKKYIKIEVFKGVSNGHSLIIQKVKDNVYKFLDPNQGIFKDYNAEELMTELDCQYKEYSHIAFLDGDSFNQDIQNNRI